MTAVLSFLILMISGLGFLGCLAAWRLRKRYRRELVWLSRLENRLREHQLARSARSPGQAREEQAETLDSAQRGQLTEASGKEEESAPSRPTTLEAALDPRELGQGFPRDSLITHRLEAIAILRSRRVRINLDTLQSMSRSRDAMASWHGFPSFIAGTVVLLGILGTFLGLGTMVRQVDLALPEGVENIETLHESVSRMRTVLGGMGAAFTSSLLGLGSALLVSSLDFAGKRARNKFFERFQHVTVQLLLPSTVPTMDDESLLERVSLQLERSFDRLDGIQRKIERSLAEAAGMQDSFVAILKAIGWSDDETEDGGTAANRASSSSDSETGPRQLERLLISLETHQAEVEKWLRGDRALTRMILGITVAALLVWLGWVVW